MCTDFVDSIIKTFIDGGFNESKDSKNTGGQFLVGFKGRLFTIEEDYQVGECLDDYDTVGCGRDIVLGSLYTSNLNLKLKPEVLFLEPQVRLEIALKAATRFSTGVTGPFNFLQI